MTTDLVVLDALLHVVHSRLCGVRVDGGHMAEHLSAIDADPIESRVGEAVTGKESAQTI